MAKDWLAEPGSRLPAQPPPTPSATLFGGMLEHSGTAVACLNTFGLLPNLKQDAREKTSEAFRLVLVLPQRTGEFLTGERHPRRHCRASGNSSSSSDCFRKPLVVRTGFQLAPERCDSRQGWEKTLLAQRKEIAYGPPSHACIPQEPDSSGEGVAQAVGETGLDCFPDACPWAMEEEVLNDDWLPDVGRRASRVADPRRRRVAGWTRASAVPAAVWRAAGQWINRLPGPEFASLKRVFVVRINRLVPRRWMLRQEILEVKELQQTAIMQVETVAEWTTPCKQAGL